MILKEYISKNHSKFLIKYHIILVCKYRKQLLVGAVEYNMKKISVFFYPLAISILLFTLFAHSI